MLRVRMLANRMVLIQSLYANVSLLLITLLYTEFKKLTLIYNEAVNV